MPVKVERKNEAKKRDENGNGFFAALQLAERELGWPVASSHGADDDMYLQCA